MKEEVFIYALINPLEDKVFYIGATVNPYTRLDQHISGRNYNGNKKQSLIHDIIVSGAEPEILILDNTDLENANYWEEFYISLFRSFGFTLHQSHMPYRHQGRNRRLWKNVKEEEKPSKLIDGKDIHYYRRQVFKYFNFFENAKYQQ